MKKRLWLLIIFLIIVILGCAKNNSVYEISGALSHNKVSSATPGTGSLSITATEVPQGVKVYLGNVLKGTVTFHNPYVITGLSPGDKIIKLTGKYNKDYQTIVNIAAGQTKTINVDLVLRHGGGSFCTSNDDCIHNDCYDLGDGGKKCRDWEAWFGVCQGPIGGYIESNTPSTDFKCKLDNKKCGYKYSSGGISCGYDFYCDTKEDVVSCVKKKDDYESCNLDLECKAGKCLVYNNDLGVAYCGSFPPNKKKDGEVCNSNSECLSKICANPYGEKSSKCLGSKYWIGECGKATAGWSCSGVKNYEKESCKKTGSTRKCGGDYYCNSENNLVSCVFKKDNEIVCDFNTECKSKYCSTVNKKCGKTNGLICGSNLECQSGKCSDPGKYSTSGKCIT